MKSNNIDKNSEENGENIVCYVYYCQQKDSTKPRGYVQSSLVLLSKLKLIKIFNVLL